MPEQTGSRSGHSIGLTLVQTACIVYQMTTVVTSRLNVTASIMDYKLITAADLNLTSFL